MNAGMVAPVELFAPKRAGLRRAIIDMPKQKVGEVTRLGMGRKDIIPLWYGESDLTTPAFICEAAHEAMREGRTFYTHKRGLPELRQALADYMGELYRTHIDVERVSVTMSGMAAIMLALDAIVEAGDNTVNITPVWPNSVNAAEIRGVEPRRVPLRQENGVWRLDLNRLFNACDARTRAIVVNSPGNPTGWMIERDQQEAILDYCRQRGIWLIADEVYARLVYDRPVAPSFLEIADPEDPLIVVNSFSKSWAMTGWRIGWITAPAFMGEYLNTMIEYSTSAVPEFNQVGALAAVTKGEPFVAELRERCRIGRDAVVPRLKDIPRVTIDEPRAAFYAFFRVDGISDSLSFAKQLYFDTKVGLAPGAAFGPEGEGWLRLCFASDRKRLDAAMDVLERYLA